MATRNSRRSKRYLALTIVRRGRLSKTHLADPSKGLDDLSKRNQEVPIEVTLTPVGPVDETEKTSPQEDPEQN